MDLHDKVWSFFDKYGSGPFDLEAIVHFILKGMDVTPYQYAEVARAVRTYIVDNYRVEQGDFKPRTDVFIRHVMVHYR